MKQLEQIAEQVGYQPQQTIDQYAIGTVVFYTPSPKPFNPIIPISTGFIMPLVPLRDGLRDDGIKDVHETYDMTKDFSLRDEHLTFTDEINRKLKLYP